MLFNCYTVQLSNCSSVQLFKSPTVQESNCLTVKLYFEIKTSQDWDFFMSTQNLVIFFFLREKKGCQMPLYRVEISQDRGFLMSTQNLVIFSGKRKDVRKLYIRAKLVKIKIFSCQPKIWWFFLRESERCKKVLYKSETSMSTHTTLWYFLVQTTRFFNRNVGVKKSK